MSAVGDGIERRGRAEVEVVDPADVVEVDIDGAGLYQGVDELDAAEGVVARLVLPLPQHLAGGHQDDTAEQ